MIHLRDYLYKTVELRLYDGRTLRGEVLPLDGSAWGGDELGIRHHKYVEEVLDEEIEEIELTNTQH